MGIQMPSFNGGTGANYGANSAYSNPYALSRSVMGMNLAYQSLANDEEFKNYVEFLNVATQFDSEYNMPATSKQVNTRNKITEAVGTNGVHPAIEGYMQKPSYFLCLETGRKGKVQNMQNVIDNLPPLTVLHP